MLGLAFAMAPPPGGAPAGGAQSALMNIVPLIFMFAIFYFLLIRPQQKKAKEHKSMLENLKKGDKVITIGGVHGKIAEMDDTTVTLDVGNQVRITFEKSAIAMDSSSQIAQNK